jgi:DNA-binding SARP family transcriptional activator
VYQGDRLITDWNGQKSKSILKFLLAHSQAPVSKDILMDVFWPDAAPEAARRNLHQAIYSLRQTLRHTDPGVAHVRFRDDCYLLNPQIEIWTDDRSFEEHVQAGRKLENEGRQEEAIAQYGIAENLYQGDYLKEDLYEEWPAARRQRLRRIYCELNDKLGNYYLEHAEYGTAIVLCHRVLAHDNCHEPAHRRLMRCYVAQGLRHLAVRQYQVCHESLREELDLEPSQETEALYRNLVQAP